MCLQCESSPQNYPKYVCVTSIQNSKETDANSFIPAGLFHTKWLPLLTPKLLDCPTEGGGKGKGGAVLEV